ncbi:MAG: nucleotidyltransferase family protein [Clostridiales bacterium]|jgi:CTP:molybdopterin cytidylyltransferase MocA|nr:nucleotidyltransferase family protein [Clostridiales bacterium]
MTLGAVIPAAGLSSRMGAFKPLLDINGVPAIERVINAFRDAGVGEIAVVTGHNAGMLNVIISRLRSAALYNAGYADGAMFDSVKIGLEYLKGRCDRVFITPADTPLFTADTVRSLLQTASPVAIPAYQGKPGHPIMLGNGAISHVMSYTGNGGLRGAIAGLRAEYLETGDSGVLYDMDTPGDYSRLLKLIQGEFNEAD